ncbi:MAG TPA: hypothetical protein PK668_12595 [Myxococcota bacterium]|nr:hypothetical protein [Myxococcota bacterium]HRY93691.1 hypothetical protein [Myxococcota bacterium]
MDLKEPLVLSDKEYLLKDLGTKKSKNFDSLEIKDKKYRPSNHKHEADWIYFYDSDPNKITALCYVIDDKIYDLNGLLADMAKELRGACVKVNDLIPHVIENGPARLGALERRVDDLEGLQRGALEFEKGLEAVKNQLSQTPTPKDLDALRAAVQEQLKKLYASLEGRGSEKPSGQEVRRTELEVLAGKVERVNDRLATIPTAKDMLEAQQRLTEVLIETQRLKDRVGELATQQTSARESLVTRDALRTELESLKPAAPSATMTQSTVQSCAKGWLLSLAAFSLAQAIVLVWHLVT